VTTSHATPVISAPDPESALAALRRLGMRISAPRRVVVEALFASPEPLSAPEIAERAPLALDPASIYANLQALEAAGLVRHVHLGHGPGRYMLSDRVARDFVGCERCGAVRALPPSALEGVRAAVRAATGFEPRFTHFPIMGLCPACRSERSVDG